MRLTELLSESGIKVPLSGKTREEVIRELIDLLPVKPGEASRQAIFDSVMEREQVMSTAIGNGIALPHGAGPIATPLAVALGIAPAPIEFMAVDGEPVNLVFLLVADRPGQADNIKALARLSRLVHRHTFRQALGACQSAAEAFQVIRDEEARHRI